MARNYSNIALDTTLVAGITAGDLTCVVASAAGWPSVPFAAVLDPGSLTVEEVVEVTLKVGTTFTITRGFDGTVASAHSAGATVRHAAIAGDFTDLQAADATNAGALATHAALATSAHGGIIASTDPRLTDARTPLAHASTHASIGSDPVTLAQSQITNLPADLVLKAPLASPTFTGVPAAPTAAPGTNTTQLATTAFVLANGGTGIVTDVTASAPLASSGGPTPDISLTGTVPSANGGTGVNNAGTLTNASNTAITGGGTLALGGFTATIPATLTVAGLAIANVFTLAQSITIDDAVTNNVTTLATFAHTNTAGTPANSFGTRLLWTLKSDTTAGRNAAALDVTWQTAADGTRRSQIGVFGVPAGSSTLTEYARFGAAGNLLWSRTSGIDALTITVSDSGGGSGMIIDSSSTGANAAFFAGSGTPAIFLARNRKNSTEVLDLFQLDRRPNNSTASGNVGSRALFTASSSTTNARTQGVIDVRWGDYIDAQRYATMALAVGDFNASERTFLFGRADGARVNVGVLGATDFASGSGVIGIKDTTTAPSGTPSGGGVLYVESGALKYKGSSGTVTTIANA